MTTRSYRRDYIRDHYQTTPIKDIAQKLGMTYDAVRQMAYRLGVTTKENHRWTLQDDLTIVKMYTPNDPFTYSKMAIALGVSRSVVKRHKEHLQRLYKKKWKETILNKAL